MATPLWGGHWEDTLFTRIQFRLNKVMLHFQPALTTAFLNDTWYHRASNALPPSSGRSHAGGRARVGGGSRNCWVVLWRSVWVGQTSGLQCLWKCHNTQDRLRVELKFVSCVSCWLTVSESLEQTWHWVCYSSKTNQGWKLDKAEFKIYINNNSHIYLTYLI